MKQQPISSTTLKVAFMFDISKRRTFQLSLLLLATLASFIFYSAAWAASDTVVIHNNTIDAYIVFSPPTTDNSSNCYNNSQPVINPLGGYTTTLTVENGCPIVNFVYGIVKQIGGLKSCWLLISPTGHLPGGAGSKSYASIAPGLPCNYTVSASGEGTSLMNVNLNQ